ncbi:tumor necrosis factor ligand superfamily member 6-like [Erpetoichthys calabaricus]|uniref:tumor necrosis factor ligand superfamily member 6-like n=1 Tax=Erpetoichthys calabaricus TaxID=27687 RepID=UPI00109EF739|nr:tumor necrosis factor ligand superfamily member 6-like [Erpetoichthys calabaricus]
MTVLNGKEPAQQGVSSSQGRLVHCLLLWVVLLSTLQILTLAVFFAVVYPQISVKSDLPSGFVIAEREGKIKEKISWEQKPGMVSNIKLINDSFQIPKDGLYYLYTKISLVTNASVNQNHTSNHFIKVKRKDGSDESDQSFLLVGDIINGGPHKASTSGYIGGQFVLNAGDLIYVNCHPPTKINPNDYETYFGIYMLQEV